jgi:hypothetical protein
MDQKWDSNGLAQCPLIRYRQGGKPSVLLFVGTSPVLRRSNGFQMDFMMLPFLWISMDQLEMGT